jgi:tellurite resistance protein TerC
MTIELIFILIFIVFFLTVFVIDLFLTGHRKDKIEVNTALRWTAVWISTAMIFAVMIYFYFPHGHEKAMEFLASYLIEYSLSVDNLFVFIMIFTIMGIKDKHQPRILKWGIIGAIVLRIIFITGGITIIQHFKFMIYIFGLILIYTSYKMLTSTNDQIDPDKNICVRIASKIFKIKCDADTDHFFVRESHHTYATIAFVTLILIESTDVIFAVDSVPAVLAITHDPFIAITSNLFAILGLRSLFFALAGILDLFRFLKYGISVILFFVGVKMLISAYIHIPVEISLGLIILCLIVSIAASILIKTKESLSDFAL